MSDIKELGLIKTEPQNEEGLLQSVESRAVAEVQSAYVIAKKFPRDQNLAYRNIMKACERPYLAEKAIYAYPRGSTLVTGETIRLAEAMAACWGNLDCGIREISQTKGMSVVEAYAIDLETNNPQRRTFHVPHVRETKQGSIPLTSSRDIYELIANQGARRLRSCILAHIPGDIREAARDRCRKTLESSDVPLEKQIQNMVLAFDGLGVKIEHLEKRLGHKLDAIIPAEIVTLKAIYRAINDGMAGREDFFDIGLPLSAESAINEILQKGKKNTKEELEKDEKK